MERSVIIDGNDRITRRAFVDVVPPPYRDSAPPKRGRAMMSHNSSTSSPADQPGLLPRIDAVTLLSRPGARAAGLQRLQPESVLPEAELSISSNCLNILYQLNLPRGFGRG